MEDSNQNLFYDAETHHILDSTFENFYDHLRSGAPMEFNVQQIRVLRWVDDVLL